jgi:hypothetical protein
MLFVPIEGNQSAINQKKTDQHTKKLTLPIFGVFAVFEFRRFGVQSGEDHLFSSLHAAG